MRTDMFGRTAVVGDSIVHTMTHQGATLYCGVIKEEDKYGNPKIEVKGKYSQTKLRTVYGQFVILIGMQL